MSESFCPTCEDYRETRVETRDETYTVRGKPITVHVEVEVCPVCAESVFDEERDAAVMRHVYDAYRQQEGLLSAEDIKAIRQGYKLSQRSLAALLGMSQATINRYENGEVQDRAHDEAIRACRDPSHVRDLLARRGNLLTDRQRRQVESAIADAGSGSRRRRGVIIRIPEEMTELTGYRVFDYDRFAAVALFFCERLARVSRTVINKLFFYADFLTFKTSTVSLTGAAYWRLDYGPAPADYGAWLSQMEADGLLVCEEVVHSDECTGFYYRPGPAAGGLAVGFTPHEREVLEHVARTFRGWTATAISRYSHREPAWLNTADREVISYAKAKDLSLSLPE